MKSPFFYFLLAVSTSVLPAVNGFGQVPITRNQIIANALPYTSFQWTAAAGNLWRGTSCGQRSVYFANWVRVGTNASMPYAWGGGSAIARFQQLIAAGKSAGDICSAAGGGCSAAGPSGAGETCVAGVDCSGFISLAWNLPAKLGTTRLQSITLGYSSLFSLKPGDILNLPGKHVRLVYYQDNTSHEFVVMEASGNGWNVGIHRYKPNDLTSYSPRYNPKAM